MDLNQLKEILTLVHEHELAELEIEQDGIRLWVRTNTAAPLVPLPAPPASASGAMAPAASPSPAGVAVAGPADTEIELAIVKSPIVGTFYRSSEPGAAAFVEVGA